MSSQQTTEEEFHPKNPKQLLTWAIENSKPGEKVRDDHLMSHEEFSKMWNDMFPDVVKQIKDNLAVLTSPDSDDEKMYLALDKLLFICEDLDAADNFVDLHGYDTITKLLEHTNPEIRMAAAWIISNSLQNNIKVQCKFTKQVGISLLLDTLDKESVEKPMIRKFGAISSAIRGFLIMRKQFYSLNGIQRLINACQKFPTLYYRFCWLIGAILDEEKPTDKEEFNKVNMKSILESNKEKIDDLELYNNVVSRL